MGSSLWFKSSISSLNGILVKMVEKIIAKFTYNGRIWKIIEDNSELYFPIWVKSDKNEYCSPQTLANSILFDMKDPKYSKLPKELQNWA